MEDYAWLCINARVGNVRSSAEADVRRPSVTRMEAQITCFGVIRSGRRGNQTADHIECLFVSRGSAGILPGA
jgi:hypothetical protein